MPDVGPQNETTGKRPSQGENIRLMASECRPHAPAPYSNDGSKSCPRLPYAGWWQSTWRADRADCTSAHAPPETTATRRCASVQKPEFLPRQMTKLPPQTPI